MNIDLSSKIYKRAEMPDETERKLIEQNLAGNKHWECYSVTDKNSMLKRYVTEYNTGRTDKDFFSWFIDEVDKSEPTEEWKPTDEYDKGMVDLKNETVSGQSRYHKGSIETIKYIESQMSVWFLNGMSPAQCFSLAQAVRYISRVGAKDDVKIELGKAINYLTRAMTGEWKER